MVEKKIVCPLCEQDYIQEIRVKNYLEKIFVCPECEAMYDLNHIKEVNENNCITINDVDKHPLGVFLEMKGYSWEDIIWEN